MQLRATIFGAVPRSMSVDYLHLYHMLEPRNCMLQHAVLCLGLRS